MRKSLFLKLIARKSRKLSGRLKMKRIRISLEEFNNFTSVHKLENTTLRLGQAVVNAFFTKEYLPCPELFHCDDDKFWDIVFDYVELY